MSDPTDPTDPNSTDVSDVPETVTAEAPTEDVAEDVAEAPTEDVAEAPTEDVAEAPTEDVAEPPAEDVAEPPAEDVAEAPAEDVAEAPAEDVAEAPAEAVTEAPTEAPTEDVAEAPTEDVTEAPTEDVTEAPAEDVAEDVAEAPTEDVAEAPTEDVAEAPTEPQAEEHVPTPAEIVAHPATPSAIPSPAMFAKPQAGPALSQHGRVAEDGVVYVKAADGSERAVGSYPGATPGGALAYFGRKYDEILASAELLAQRLTQTDVSAKDAEESYAKLVEQSTEPHAVGDLAALEAKVAEIAAVLEAKKATEAQERAAAREEGRVLREALVSEAEKIAGQPVERIQWKTSGARMRELLDDWKQHQRSGPRLDRPTETALWQRFSSARNSFDRARRVHFAQLDSQQSEAKQAKTRLVAEAERLATSKDWAPTAGAFKKLMDEWRRAGRAGRSDDDALWERFRAAQDAFFQAKDAVVAAEEESFRDNLAVKEQLIVEADQLLPVKDLEQAKSALRSIQDRWDKAGKVPRADLERTEKALRRVEQAVRDIEDKKWTSSNPEAAARARSLVDQLEAAVAGLEADLAKAEASGNAKKIDQAKSALEAREAWLAQARSGLEEFGG